MDIVSVAIIAAGLLLYALVSGRLEGTVVTAPLVFVAFGFLAGPFGLSVTNVDASHSAIHTIAELTLILVLFADASRIDLRMLWRDHNLPVRMLAIGMPLTIVAGMLAATQLFPEFSFWEAALLAALLAPTDAALGQTVVTAQSVPQRIRQAINIESGLNDGIALPAVLLFAALASIQPGANETTDWVHFGLLQVTLGPLVGIAVAYAGTRLLDESVARGWSSGPFQGIGILALALLVYLAAELMGGNGFIAAFVGGMVFGNTIRHSCTFLLEFMETEGQLLMLITFLVFGAVLLPDGLKHLTVKHFFYAVLALTFIRMLPIALSLIGLRLRVPTILFLGWFGPRGLASILFVLLILETSEVPHREAILSITVITVALSGLLHGITAAPLAQWYGRWAKSVGECEESGQVGEMPLRHGHAKHTMTSKAYSDKGAGSPGSV